MPIALWLARNASAAEPVVRYDISTPDGAAMLGVYADAVSRMQALGPDTPLSWMWQWYTHFVDGVTTKANEITRLFGSTSTTMGAFANATWNTCQSHSGQNANNFLPWHRMYLYFMEQIVRQVSGRPDFAMPYWNYTSPDPALRGVLPQQFRSPADPLYGVLYRSNRTSLANTGQPIQKYQPGDAMDISAAMAATAYSTVGTVQGFCRAIDSGIHGRIHVLVGTSKNMGAVPYAARDPLFWVHHSSIDRMWASWNANGGVNPATASWAKKAFVFADGSGQQVSGALKDFFDMSRLGYVYDTLIPATTLAKRSASVSATTTTATPLRVASARNAIDLGERAVHVPLLPTTGVHRTQVLGVDPLERDKHTYLVIKDLHTWKQPEVLYDVYLQPLHGGTGLNNATRVGDINFFDAEFHDHGNGAMAEALGENFYSFDVTDLLRALAGARGADARDGLLVSFVPAGHPTAGAGPMVSSVELVRQ
jgi:hypothetical protein